MKAKAEKAGEQVLVTSLLGALAAVSLSLRFIDYLRFKVVNG